MSLNNRLDVILKSVADEANRVLGDKLDAVVLYGSYARGDYDDESDIDIMIRIDCPIESLEDYGEAFDLISSRLSLENDITVSIILRDKETFFRYKNALPFFSNIEKEGVKIA